MIYIEYIERDRFMPIEIFHELGDQRAWKDPKDEGVGILGRSMRLGADPAYMSLCRYFEDGRIDEWEDYFVSDPGLRDLRLNAKQKAVHKVAGGCYDEVIGRARLDEGLYFVEFFSAGDGHDRDAVKAHFAKRAEGHVGGELCFVLRRIGLLGPDPGDLALWRFPSHAALEAIARERHGYAPFRPTRAGVYRTFGQEIL